MNFVFVDRGLILVYMNWAEMVATYVTYELGQNGNYIFVVKNPKGHLYCMLRDCDRVGAALMLCGIAHLKDY